VVPGDQATSTASFLFDCLRARRRPASHLRLRRRHPLPRHRSFSPSRACVPSRTPARRSQRLWYRVPCVCALLSCARNRSRREPVCLPRDQRLSRPPTAVAQHRVSCGRCGPEAEDAMVRVTVRSSLRPLPPPLPAGPPRPPFFFLPAHPLSTPRSRGAGGTTSPIVVDRSSPPRLPLAARIAPAASAARLACLPRRSPRPPAAAPAGRRSCHARVRCRASELPPPRPSHPPVAAPAAPAVFAASAALITPAASSASAASTTSPRPASAPAPFIPGARSPRPASQAHDQRPRSGHQLARSARRRCSHDSKIGPSESYRAWVIPHRRVYRGSPPPPFKVHPPPSLTRAPPFAESPRAVASPCTHTSRAAVRRALSVPAPASAFALRAPHRRSSPRPASALVFAPRIGARSPRPASAPTLCARIGPTRARSYACLRTCSRAWTPPHSFAPALAVQAAPTLVRTRTRAPHTRTRASRTRTGALSHARSRSLVCALSHARSHSRSRSRALTLAHALTRALHVRSCARTRTRTRARTCTRTRARTLHA
jgi:hypothetical protein